MTDTQARAALHEAIEAFFAVERPASTDRDGIRRYELALSRFRVAYGVYRGYIEPCPVPSSTSGQPCLLPAGHPQDSGTRFHRYAPPSPPLPDAERLDVERLARAMAAETGVAWPASWRESDFAWVARQVGARYVADEPGETHEEPR